MLVDTAIVGRLGTAQLGGLASRGDRAVVRRHRLQLPDLRHDRARRPPPRRRPTGRGRRRRRPDDVAVGARRRPVWPRCCSLGRPSLPGCSAAERRPRLRRHVPAISAVGVPFVVFALAAQGVQRGKSDYLTPLVDPARLERRQRAARARVRVRARAGACPGRRGRRSSPRSAPASPSRWSCAAAPPGVDHRGPSRAGMVPLLTAGAHLLLRVGSMLAVFAGRR